MHRIIRDFSLLNGLKIENDKVEIHINLAPESVRFWLKRRKLISEVM